MSLSVFYYSIWVCLLRCRSFNPSLLFVAFSSVLCHCFKAMSLVGIYPYGASVLIDYEWPLFFSGSVKKLTEKQTLRHVQHSPDTWNYRRVTFAMTIE